MELYLLVVKFSSKSTSGFGQRLCLNRPNTIGLEMAYSGGLFLFYKWISGDGINALFKLFSCANTQFLVAVTLLQLILSSIAFFTLNSAITNTYYLVQLFMIDSFESTILASSLQRTLHTWTQQSPEWAAHHGNLLCRCGSNCVRLATHLWDNRNFAVFFPFKLGYFPLKLLLFVASWQSSKWESGGINFPQLLPGHPCRLLKLVWGSAWQHGKSTEPFTSRKEWGLCWEG